MITYIFIVAIVIGFASEAHGKNRIPLAWSAIGIASYYIMQIVVGFLFALTYRNLFQNYLNSETISIVTGLVGVCIAYYILTKLPDTKKVIKSESDLLDNDTE
jgi:threonine/homoserine/homoserine lactone efflux protein